MPTGNNSHLHVVLTTFVVPLVSTVVMEVLETVADPSAFDWRDRLMKTGWDLNVLALGTSGAIFTLPAVQKYLSEFAVETAFVTFCFTAITGMLIAAIRRKKAGWRSLLALLIGGIAICIPWVLVLKS